MAGTRSSTRQANGSSSKSASQTASNNVAGIKRKAEAAPTTKSKRGRKPKEQKTLEETMPDVEDESKTEQPESEEPEIESEEENKENKENTGAKIQESSKKAPEKIADDAMDTTPDSKPANGDEPTNVAEELARTEENTKTGSIHTDEDDKTKQDTIEESTANGESSNIDNTGKHQSDNTKNEAESASSIGTAVEHSPKRDDSTPSSILEKGIIYFFFRGRVGIDEPSQVDEIARSYIVLRPLPHGAKLGEGAIGDAQNSRLLALPKKVLPLSGRDRFMVFVEKANASMEEIKSVMGASDYMTKTAGARHTPAMAPVGEGIYAVTTTGRESHLAYMITIPSELSEVQQDIGLKEQGSFVTSVKNPKYEGPANANLPKGADFTKEIFDEFRGLRWMPLQPKHLNFENAQFIIIGSGGEGLDKATRPQAEDEEEKKDTPLQEMEKLESEDEIRVKHLAGDDSVFKDLGLSKKEHPGLQTSCPSLRFGAENKRFLDCGLCVTTSTHPPTANHASPFVVEYSSPQVEAAAEDPTEDDKESLWDDSLAEVLIFVNYEPPKSLEEKKGSEWSGPLWTATVMEKWERANDRIPLVVVVESARPYLQKHEIILTDDEALSPAQQLR
ncbi:MAG: hypothetical protein MMC33_010616 [Icmadophila ericetorum]|nr:hypothetical protein [Icmadophila ericetorum]